VAVVSLGFGAWLAMLMAPAPAPAVEGTPAERWIRADAAICVEVPRPAELIARAAQPRLRAALTAVPPVAKFYQGSTYRTIRTLVDKVAETLGMSASDALVRLTAGGLTLAVEGEPGEPPRTFLIATPEDAACAARAIEAVLDLARRDAADHGRGDPVTSGEYRGVTAYRLDKGAFALVDGSLAIADRPETLRMLVDRARDGLKADQAGRGRGAGALAEDEAWKARRAAVAPDTLAWGVARLETLRRLDPRRFTVPEKLPPQATFLFGSWFEALRSAPWIEASLGWGDERLRAAVSLPAPAGGYREAFQGFVPGPGEAKEKEKGKENGRALGAAAPLRPPGTIASLSLWRDFSAIWEARSELFAPEVQQNLAKLDTFAGQFFGGRDFGSGVLGALDPGWRLVVAHQDYDALNPRPDVKLPGFALIADLDPDDDEFSQRLKVAYQSFVGLSNLNAAQKSAPPLEMGSEVFDGVTISTARFMVSKADVAADAASRERRAVDQRFNLSPSIAQVDNHFILSTSLGLTRALVHALKTPEAASASAATATGSGAPPATLQVEADGPALARLVALNRDRLVMQNMLEKGHDQAAAAAEVGQLERLLNALGRGRLTVEDTAATLRFDLSFLLNDPR
jgi:hypothetical protein